MRLLHAASSYPLAAGDATAPFMEEMLSALANSGHDVTVVVPRVQGLQEGLRQSVRVIGAPYAPRPWQVWGYGRSLNVRNRLRASATALTPVALGSMAAKLRSEISRHKPDVIHLHWVLPQGILALSLPQTIPIVVSAHGADARFVRGSLRMLARRVLKRADALVAASSEILDVMASSFPEIRDRTGVIPHGANPKLFRQSNFASVRRDLGLELDATVILAVGRLVRKKGFSQLIRSLEELEIPGWQLYIIGTGPQMDQLQASVPENMANRIHLIGAQPRADVAKWMAAADVVVIPSTPHGHDIDSGPVVLVEALAAGTPVVSTPIGMAPAVIQDGANGYLIDSSDPSLLAEALTKAVDAAQELGEGARKTFEALGDWSRVADQLELVYEQAIAHRRVASN